MFISQKTAKKELRARAGFSVAAAHEAVKNLPKRKFGAREKVNSADIEKIIRDAGRPSPPKERTIRPSSAKKRATTRRLLGLPV